MDEKLKRRLAGAAVLLALAFIVVSLLPTPQEAARQPDGEVVTIPLGAEVSGTDGAIAPTPPDAAVLAPAASTTDADPRHHDADVDIDAAGDDDLAAEPSSARPASGKSEPSLPEPPAVAELEPKPAVKPSAAVAASKPPPVAKPVDSKPVAAPSPAPSAVAKVPVAGGASGDWYVQIGGFADIANARQAQARVQAAGQSGLLAPTETAKGTIYRVRAGPFASREAAQLAQSALAAKGFADAKLIGP